LLAFPLVSGRFIYIEIVYVNTMVENMIMNG